MAYSPFGCFFVVVRFDEGVGDEILNESDGCLWVNTFAILVGVYVTIPIIGAIVLVRLLDNRADIIESTDIVLLTVRDGVPEVTIRVVCANGRFLPNFSATMEAWVRGHDSTHDEGYMYPIRLELETTTHLAYFASPLKHICDKNSPLIQKGVVTVDKHGVPRWDKKKIHTVFLTCNATGSRWHCKTYNYSPITFVEPDENGRNPFFVNCVPVLFYHWFKFKGRVTPVSDLSKLSSWKYKDRGYGTSNTKSE